MVTYQFVLPEKIATQEFMEDLAHTHGGFTAWSAKGAWMDPYGDLTGEPVTVFQVSTDNYADLIYRVRQQCELFAEKALYFGTVGEHRVINL